MVSLDTLQPPRFDNTRAWMFLTVPFLLISFGLLLFYLLAMPEVSTTMLQKRLNALPSFQNMRGANAAATVHNAARTATANAAATTLNNAARATANAARAAAGTPNPT